ncbi:hypothetical protein OJJOAM_002949 [Cupriavidus sp. H18C1]
MRLTGVVDQHADRAQRPGGRVEPAGHAVGIADVGLDWIQPRTGMVLPKALHRARQRVAVAAQQRHAGAVGQQPTGNRRSDAARAAGDQRVPPVQRQGQTIGAHRAPASAAARSRLVSSCRLPAWYCTGQSTGR